MEQMKIQFERTICQLQDEGPPSVLTGPHVCNTDRSVESWNENPPSSPPTQSGNILTGNHDDKLSGNLTVTKTRKFDTLSQRKP